MILLSLSQDGEFHRYVRTEDGGLFETHQGGITNYANGVDLIPLIASLRIRPPINCAFREPRTVIPDKQKFRKPEDVA